LQDIYYMTIKQINKRRTKYVQFKRNYCGLQVQADTKFVKNKL